MIKQTIFVGDDFFRFGGKVEFYDHGRCRRGTLNSMEEVLDRLNDVRWRSEYYMRISLNGREYILMRNQEDDTDPYIWVEHRKYQKIKTRVYYEQE